MANKFATIPDLFTGIANAIRNKKGTSALIIADDFPDEIANLQTGIDTSDATATADDIALNKTAYVNDTKLTGTFTLDDELATQADLISQINEALVTKGIM